MPWNQLINFLCAAGRGRDSPSSTAPRTSSTAPAPGSLKSLFGFLPLAHLAPPPCPPPPARPHLPHSQCAGVAAVCVISSVCPALSTSGLKELKVRSRLVPSCPPYRSAADFREGEGSGPRPHSKPAAESGSDLHFLAFPPNHPALSLPVPTSGKSPPLLDGSSCTCPPGLFKVKGR